MKQNIKHWITVSTDGYSSVGFSVYFSEYSINHASYYKCKHYAVFFKQQMSKKIF